MIEKLSQRDRRVIRIGGIAAAAIVVFVFGMDWIQHWVSVRESLKIAKVKLQTLDTAKAERAGLMTIVPVFEMPEAEEKQMLLFRDKLNEQLKRAGVQSKPMQVLPVSKSSQGAYKLLRLKCNGKCRFGQALDLLARLNENPYLVGIEELQIRCDPKQRQEIELDLTVSTFIK